MSTVGGKLGKNRGRAKLEKSEVEGEIVKNRGGGQNRIVTNF